MLSTLTGSVLFKYFYNFKAWYIKIKAWFTFFFFFFFFFFFLLVNWLNIFGSFSVSKIVKSPHAYINVLTRGDLSSLRWLESPLKYFNPEVNPRKSLCTVYYASLNFRDVMLATGKLPPDAIPGNMADQDCILGMEFSGRLPDGKKVMGLLAAKVNFQSCISKLLIKDSLFYSM